MIPTPTDDGGKSMTQTEVRPPQAGEIVALEVVKNYHQFAVVASVPDQPRPPLLLAVPLIKSAEGDAELYPVLGAGQAGLGHSAAVLIDRARVLDKRREYVPVGTLTSEQYAPVRTALARLLDLDLTPGRRASHATWIAPI
jgi:mRNA-degrading endonuclease toxin of MazEF toxin-antitoxin module